MKVTRSYWPGLFHCYDVADLPRTNNDLEQLFGATATTSGGPAAGRWRRRGWWCMGSVRLVAAVATRLRGEVRGEDLAPSDLEAWRELRAGLERRQRSGAGPPVPPRPGRLSPGA